MNKTLPINVWKAALHFADNAILITHAYDDHCVYYFETLNKFVVAKSGKPLIELAHKFIEVGIAESFADEYEKNYKGMKL